MGETNPQALTQSAAGPSPHALRARAKKPIVFGKYELLSRYRVGGMAEVWTARRLGTGGEPSLVAIKRILPSFTDEADYIAMFRDEARLGEKLTHPNIAATYEIGQVDDHPFIALEHVRGQNVAALIRKAREQEEPVPASMALRIAVDVCRALEHAHSLTDGAGNPLEIVHRDVSPTNILLGYDGAVKLIDFGIAKSNDQLMRTQAGLLKGKHGYLSPEQAAGEPIDARSDLFSLAICIWEMLAAKRLFLGASDFSSIARVREAVVPPLFASGASGASGQSGAQAALESVLQRALSRDRDARYASATELREALEQASGEGVAIATDTELATYLKEVFADEIALEAGDDALEAPSPYEGTGLLDAFDDLEPVSTVSTLAVMPDAPDEPVASDSDEEIDEDLDLMEVSSQTAPEGESFDMVREPEADTESDDTQLEASDTDTTGQHEAPVFDVASETVESSVAAIEAAADEQASAAEAEPDTQTVDEPVSAHATPVELAAPAATEAEQSGEGDEEQAEEPTRVVAYRSIESGEVSAAQAPALAAGEPSLAAAATLPGMGGVEWDDEELSTHLYDGPSAATVPLPGSAGEASAVEAESTSSERPSVPPFGGRPSVAPFSSRPGAPQFVLRPSGAPPSVAPSAIAPAAPITQRPAAQASPPWLLPALIVATVVIGTIAFSMLRSATPGTIHLTTQPPDAEVMFDGRKVESTLSPFVIGSVVPGERHAISVARDGYRTWQTQIVVGDGQTLQLPEVVLVPKDDAPKPVAVAAPVPKVEEPEAPSEPKKPEIARAEPREPRTQPAPVPAPSRPRTERPAPSATATPTPAPAPARPAPAAVAPPVVAGSETGMLRVNSRPWAQVHVDGRLVGNTPQMALRLSPGKHTVLLLNPELKVRKTFTVQIKRGSVTTKIVELL